MASTIVIDFILLIAITFSSIKERKFTLAKVGKGTLLTQVMFISSLIYALSFAFRIIVNCVALFDNHKIDHLQCRSCMDCTPGYAMFIFWFHFIGELLPLSAIFVLQLVTISKQKHSKDKISLLRQS